MSRPESLGGQRMTAKRRAAEAAVASAALAEARPAVSDRRQREATEATIRTLEANAARWDAQGFPVSAERARGLIARELASLEPEAGARGA